MEARNALSYIKHIFKDPETRCRDIFPVARILLSLTAVEVWTDYQRSATHGKSLEQHTSLISITSNSLFSNCHMATALDAITIDYHFSRRGVYLSKKIAINVYINVPGNILSESLLALLPAGMPALHEFCHCFKRLREERSGPVPLCLSYLAI